MDKAEKTRRAELKKICKKTLRELKGAKAGGYQGQPYGEWLLRNFGSAADYERQRAAA